LFPAVPVADPRWRRRRVDILRLLLCGVVGLPVLLSCVAPGLAAQASSSPDTFEERVLEVIRKHPAAILEALERYEQQKQQEQSEKQAALIRQLFPVPQQIIGASPVLGEQGGILLV